MREQERKSKDASWSHRLVIAGSAATLGIALATAFGSQGANAQMPAAPLACPSKVSSDDGIAGVCVTSSARQDSQATGLGMVLPLQKAQEALLMHGMDAVVVVIDLYRASSEQQNPLAEYDLGYFYEKGMGVSRDPAQALVLYRRAFAHATDDRLRLMAEAAITGLEARQTASAAPGALGHDPAAIDIMMPAAVDDPSDVAAVAAPAEVAEVKAATAEPMPAKPPPPEPITASIAGETIPVRPAPTVALLTAAAEVALSSPARSAGGTPPSIVVTAPSTHEAAPHPMHVVPAALVADLVSRGNEMLRQGDIGTARLLYERAASAGSAKAAIWVARTHDPRFLEQIHAIGIASNAAAAADWYRRAAELGDHNADQFLAGLETDRATSFER